VAPLLAHNVLTAPKATPARAMLVLHGILGSRSNWRSIARRLAQARPDWAFVLVDLRMHGDSTGFEPPHTLASAAEDLRALMDQLALPVEAVLAHSFGGKVALTLADGESPKSMTSRAPMASNIVLVDSMPGARPDGRGSESTLAVVAMLRALPARFASRDAFVVDAMARGQSEMVARWLAMNLEPEGDGAGYRLRLDLDAIESMLDDYFARDLWHVVEGAASASRIDMIIGGDSPVFDADDRARAERAAASSERVHTHVIEGAGHWVHVDAPDRLLEIASAALGATELP
jgi:pimeloyl-ACP methyl ester carboxylesterase